MEGLGSYLLNSSQEIESSGSTWVRALGYMPGGLGTQVHILFLLLQKYPSLEFPFLDPFGLRWELTDQDKQSGDDETDVRILTCAVGSIHVPSQWLPLGSQNLM